MQSGKGVVSCVISPTFGLLSVFWPVRLMREPDKEPLPAPYVLLTPGPNSFTARRRMKRVSTACPLPSRRRSFGPQTQVIPSILAGGRKGKMEIPVCNSQAGSACGKFEARQSREAFKMFRLSRTSWVTLLLFVGVWVFSGTSVYAQTGQGILTGSVSDSTGAMIPGTTVVVRNQNTGFTYNAVTNQEGIYRVP